MHHRKLKRWEREKVYNMFSGHCAYCGKKIAYREMQVDHIHPLNKNGEDSLANMFPSCASCNNYKGALTLEQFRDRIESLHNVLMRDSVTYKNAVRFGVMIPVKDYVCEFYFEKKGVHHRGKKNPNPKRTAKGTD